MFDYIQHSSFSIYSKADIFNGEPLVEPHLFVESADGLHLKIVVIGVEVVRSIEQRQTLLLNHIVQRELIHDRTVGFEVKDALSADDFTITVKKLR